jgi:outer membrane protein
MKPLLVFCAAAVFTGSAWAQSEIRIEKPNGIAGLRWFTRPYQARTVPAVKLENSPRLDSLIRAGNLYLTAADVVALAIENNLDIEVQRYGPLLASEVLKRAQGGGAKLSDDAAGFFDTNFALRPSGAGEHGRGAEQE